MHATKAKTTHSASPTPPKARVQVAFKKKPTETLRFHDHSSCHRHCQTFLPSHPIAFSTTTAPNNARLTLLLPIATTPNLPPPDPRVPAQDSLATLAPQRQHQWLCLFQQRQPPASTQFHEQREQRRVDDKTSEQQLQFLRARTAATALLETRHQARADCQPGCAHGEAQGDVSEEG